ncbi:MAG TPA: FAD-binding protein, partial [Phenylobacterium sp.]
MSGVVARLRSLFGVAAATGPALTTIKSWMNIFQTDVQTIKVATVDELAEIVRRGGYFCIGASHSYNGVQIVRDATALVMKGSGLWSLDYDETTDEVTVGPAVTILQLKTYLVQRGRRPISSGNFMAQTVIGALATGTHGYGDQAVMAQSVTALEFLDGQGQRVRLAKGDPGFEYAALAFGVIAPIVSLTLKTAPVQSFEARTIVCRMSEKAGHVTPQHAVMYAVFPYTDREDPTIALQILRPAPAAQSPRRTGSPFFTLRAISEFIIHRYWVFDRLFPALRRPFQRLIARLDVRYERVYYTDPNDLDYLYDPAPGLESSRSPDILKNLLSPTHTAYNLAFFVRLEDAPRVVRFVMQQAEQFRELG